MLQEEEGGGDIMVTPHHVSKGQDGSAGGYGAAGHVIIRNRSAEEIYGFMTCVEKSPRWNDRVKSVEVVRCDGSTKHVNQVMQWAFMGAVKGDFQLALSIRENPEKMKVGVWRRGEECELG